VSQDAIPTTDSERATRAPLPVIAGLVTTIAAILGLNLVVLKVALQFAGPVTVQGFAAVVAAATFFVVARASGAPLGLQRAQIFPALAVAMTLTVGSSLGVVFGVARIDVGVASLLMSTTPITALVLGWVLLRERHTWHGVAGVVLGVCGVAIVASAVRGRGETELLGVAFMLVGSASWSLGLVLMKRLAEGIERSTFIAWQTCLGIPVLLGVAWGVEGLQMEVTWLFVLAVGYAGAFSKGLSFFLQLTVVRLGSSTHAATTAFLIPIFGTLAGVVLLSEAVRIEQVLGAVAILGGVALVLRSRIEIAPVVG
jgi:drug/metabolite transporter (DMT)-like permease